MIQITEEDYKITKWSGGTTTQIAIWPPDGDYGTRNFDFRISSATVEDEESTFTVLPGVHRFLTILEGELTVTTGNREPERLSPLKVIQFEGEDKTTSRGKVRDFNLMVKKGSGSMRALVFKGKLEIDCENMHSVLYGIQGTPEVFGGEEKLVLEPSTGIWVMPGEANNITLVSPKKCQLILCQMNEDQE